MNTANKGVSLIMIALVAIVFIILGTFAYMQFFSKGSSEENINFSKFGNLVINNPGLDADVWYLVYEAPGKPAEMIKLSFDASSSCKNIGGSCLDLYQGERVSIKGISREGYVSVKELESLDNSQSLGANSPMGVDWDLAVEHVSNCNVLKVYQNHDKEVYLNLKDDKEIFTIEPEIDSIVTIINQNKEKCGSVPIATE